MSKDAILAPTPEEVLATIEKRWKECEAPRNENATHFLPIRITLWEIGYLLAKLLIALNSKDKK